MHCRCVSVNLAHPGSFGVITGDVGDDVTGGIVDVGRTISALRLAACSQRTRSTRAGGPRGQSQANAEPLAESTPTRSATSR